MNNIKKLSSKIFIILIPILIVLSLGLLIISKGFHFTEFKNRIEMVVTSESSDDKENFIKNIKNSNEAYLDSESGLVYFQHISKQQVEESLKEYNVTLELKEVLVNNKYILENYFIFFVFTFIFFSTGIFYVVLKDWGQVSKKELLKFFTPYFLTYTITTVIFLGLLSLISRFYYVREFEFTPIYLINIFVSVLFTLSVFNIDKNAETSVLIGSRRLIAKLKSSVLPFLVLCIFFIPALTVGLGVRTIPIWISLVVGLIVIYATTLWIYKVIYINFSLSNFKQVFKKQEFKKKSVQIKQAERKINKKDKKKKKKKRK